MNMKNWLLSAMKAEKKKALPILSFPGMQLLGVSVNEMLQSPRLQAECMKVIADKFDTLAAVSVMDLSVEAEAFGSAVQFSDDEVPTVVDAIVEDADDVDALVVPAIGAARTGVCIEAIRLAKQNITDRPVFAGVIGPFSLAGRLMSMTEIMVNCLVEPELTHTVIEKSNEFIIKYCLEMKAAGADGVVIAEPAAGLLSPEICENFSSAYVKKIVEEVQDDDFIVVYHNCGNTVPLVDSILSIGCAAYHFGDAVEMTDILERMPSNVPVLGNLSPVEHFRSGTSQSVKAATAAMLEKTKSFENYIPSSGCDIPPAAPIANIEAFFEAVDEFYKGR